MRLQPLQHTHGAELDGKLYAEIMPLSPQSSIDSNALSSEVML